MYAYSWTFPLPHACHYAFSWATPPPFKRMYFMDDPMVQLFETKLSETLCETTVYETMFGHYALKEKIWNSGMSFWSKKWTSCAKDNFFRKTIDIIFMYLLTLLIMQNLKKTVRADPELWRHFIFWPKTTHLPEEIFFRKTTDIISIYLLAPLIVQNVKKSLQLIHYSYRYSWDHTFFGPK